MAVFFGDSRLRMVRMGGGGRKRVALDGNKERLMQMNGFGFAKKAASKCS